MATRWIKLNGKMEEVIRNILNRLVASHEDDLNEWEQGFIESLESKTLSQYHNISEGQYDSLEKMWKKHEKSPLPVTIEELIDGKLIGSEQDDINF